MAQGKVQGHRDLRVWRESMDLAVEVYKVALRMPESEKFGLTSQMRRAAASVAANIAEGAGRNSPADFSRFLSIASGSLSELETHLLLSERLGFISVTEQMESRIRFIRTMLIRLSRAVRNGPR
jgi:four helix bundle protein